MTSETPQEQAKAVKSAAQAQLPASTQNAEPRLQAPQSPPQTAAAKRASASAAAFDHDRWRDTLQELQKDRDTNARVTAEFVLEGNWDLAARVAKKYEEVQQAIAKHLAVLPDRKAENGAD